ncbi:MAG: PQQ-binding-like beta-propeller repeat protein [Rubripirellula sp.]|nr:PQQ-binding-like beta-propeller repeat protein [Rubripirellula sp.]
MIRPMPRFKLLFMLLVACLISDRSKADWPSWRGPHDMGSIEQGQYPAKLDAEHLRWKTPLPGKGCSTPIVDRGVIYVTAPKAGQDALLAIDPSGKELWATTFGSEVAGKHRNGSGSNASPVTDGATIFVYYKSGTLAAVERDGSVRWQTNLVDTYGKDTLFWDHGTSPVVTADHVIMARMHNGESWLAAFDKQTGELAWKVARNYQTPVECDHGYTSPMIISHNGKDAILLWGAQHLTIHDPADGKEIWSCGNFNPESNKLWPAIAMPVIVKDMAVICFGRNDRGLPRLFGVRLSGNGDVTDTNHAWQRDDISSFVPSPLAFQDRVYMVRDQGQVECIEPTTGETIWSNRFPKSRAKFYASPLIANDKLYAAREDGVVFVANIADGKFEVLSENDMGQSVIGSPVPTKNQILIRGEKELRCYRNRKPAK